MFKCMPSVLQICNEGITAGNELLLGEQLCQNGFVIQRFGYCLCLHHQG
jgi:hypothetical protein